MPVLLVHSHAFDIGVTPYLALRGVRQRPSQPFLTPLTGDEKRPVLWYHIGAMRLRGELGALLNFRVPVAIAKRKHGGCGSRLYQAKAHSTAPGDFSD